MATGDVKLRFSVENAETVRVALEKLGKDGEKALASIKRAQEEAAQGGGKGFDEQSQSAAAFGKALDMVQSKLLSMGGTGGSAASLMAKFAGVGLIGLGFTAAAVAVGYFYDQMNPKARTAEELLTEQARLIEAIRKGYEETGNSARGYFDAVIEFQARQNQTDSQKQLTEGTRNALLGTMFDRGGRPMTLNIGTGAPEVVDRFKDFSEPLLKLFAGFERGNPDLITFRKEIADLGLATPALAPLVAELIKLTDATAKLDPEKIAAVRRELDATSQVNAEKSFAAGLSAMLQMAPKENEEILRKQKLADLERERARRMIEIDSSAALSADREVQRARVNAAFAAAEKEINKDKVDRFDTLSQQIADNISETELLIETNGRSTAALTKMKTEHDLLRAAKRAERDITPELRAEIDKLAESYGRVTQNLAQAKLVGDIRFDRDQLGRDSLDATAASRLRGAGLPVDLNSTLASDIRLNEQLKISKDLAVDLGSTFARDLAKGVKPIDALTSALTRLEGKLIDLVMNQAISGVFKSLFPASGSIGSAGNSMTGLAGDPTGGGLVVTASAHGNVFASGGIVNRPTLFAFAGGTGLMGEAGPEAIMPLSRGRDGNLGVRGGGTVVNVQVNNRTDASVDVQQQKNSSGGVDLVVAINQAVKREMAQGGYDAAMGANYGARRRVKGLA